MTTILATKTTTVIPARGRCRKTAFRVISGSPGLGWEPWSSGYG